MARAAKLDLRVVPAGTRVAARDQDRGAGRVVAAGLAVRRRAVADPPGRRGRGHRPCRTCVPVPLTRPWFLGIANIRGNLLQRHRLRAASSGREHAGAGARAGRLVLFGPRAGELNAGIVVQRVLGLRNLAELAPAAPPPDAPAWYAQRWMDARRRRLAGNRPRAARAAIPAFLQVGSSGERTYRRATRRSEEAWRFRECPKLFGAAKASLGRPTTSTCRRRRSR